MKRLGYIIIPILAILLMSHNANAYSEFGQGFQRDFQFTSSAMVWYEYAGGGWHSQEPMNSNGSMAFATSNADAVRNVNRFLIRFVSSASNPPFVGGNKYVVYIPFRFCVNNPDELKAFIGFTGNGFSNVVSQEAFNVNGYCIEGHLTVLFQPNVDTNAIYLGSGNDNGSVIGEVYDGFSMVFNKATIIPVIGDDIPTANEIADAVNNQQKQETQDASDDSSAVGSSSSSDATTATSSLISVIGGFVSVVTSATPTNCLIDADLNHIDMGNIDLCANPVPSYIQIIGSIILICAVIPLAIILFNRFIGLFRSFQG